MRWLLLASPFCLEFAPPRVSPRTCRGHGVASKWPRRVAVLPPPLLHHPAPRYEDPRFLETQRDVNDLGHNCVPPEDYVTTLFSTAPHVSPSEERAFSTESTPLHPKWRHSQTEISALSFDHVSRSWRSSKSEFVLLIPYGREISGPITANPSPAEDCRGRLPSTLPCQNHIAVLRVNLPVRRLQLLHHPCASLAHQRMRHRSPPTRPKWPLLFRSPPVSGHNLRLLLPQEASVA